MICEPSTYELLSFLWAALSCLTIVLTIIFIAGGFSWDMLAFYLDPDYVKKYLAKRYKDGDY